jgi:hypothetical protein
MCADHPPHALPWWAWIAVVGAIVLTWVLG